MEFVEFLGKPMSHWIEIDRDLKEKDYSELIGEVCTLRAKASYYEKRIHELTEFMKINLEVTG